MESTNTKYAGFWIRFVAWMIDSTVLTVASWLLELLMVGAIYWVRVLLKLNGDGDTVWDVFNPLLLQGINFVLYLLMAIPYYGWGQFKYGTTWGKRPFRIYVVDAATLQPMTLQQSMTRCFAYTLSYIPLMCGYLMAAFHPEKKGLHDLVAKTVSIVKAKA